MNCCAKCSKLSGVLLLLVGIAFLLQNLGTWSFWGLDWWTVAFLLLGLGTLGSACCAGCQSCCGSECEMPAATAKKKQ